MKFPFNQPDKTKDCGYRCLYFALDLPESYDKWLENFKMFAPPKHGIYFSDICQVFNYYEREYKFTTLTEKGLYIIYSGCYLKHGHYFVYKDGVVYCSTKDAPERMPLETLIERMETKSSDHGFKVLKVLWKGAKNDIKKKPWEKEEEEKSK